MTPLPDSVAGVILAGGRSSRMGQDKAGLSYGGHTLLDHMQDILHQAGLSHIHISNGEGIPDEWANRGPLAGIHATVKALHARYTHLLYVPVDMPALTPSLLRALIDAPATHPAVCFTGRILPFRLKTEPHWIDVIDTMLCDGIEVSLRAFHRRIGTENVTPDPGDAPCFINVNTPDEWRLFTGGTS